MTSQRHRVHVEILQEYVDNELDSAARLELARHLIESPEDRAVVDAYQRQQEALHTVYDDVLAEPLPDSIKRVLERTGTPEKRYPPGRGRHHGRARGAPQPRHSHPRRGRWRRRIVAVVAGLALLTTGATAGWLIRGELHQRYMQEVAVDTFLRHAMNAYSLYEGQETPWSSPAVSDMSRFVSSFRETAGVDFTMPELQSSDYKFVGAWAVPSPVGPAGQMLYRDPEGRRVAVFIQINDPNRPDLLTRYFRGDTQGPSARSFVRRNDLSVYYWRSGPATYALVGDLEERALSSIADALSARGPTD